jgi:hypothetical protein
MNATLLEAFATLCRSRGAPADGVVLDLAGLDADAAPGGSALEFLPVCGVMALGARAATDERRVKATIEELHARADDLRFRVRDAVVDALARIGATRGEALVAEMVPWMDGYFHAAAVVRALARDAWLSALHDGSAVAARLDEAFILARDAPRAAARYPGHKALVEALGAAPGAIAARFGVVLFDLLAQWSATQEPALRDAIERALRHGPLKGRYADEIERVHAALRASTPAPRNPDHDFGPMRGRGKKRGRR